MTDVHDTLTRVMRRERGRLMAALIGQLGDVQLAEDCLQEAMTRAVTHWQGGRVPASPEGWLLTVARRVAIDGMRRAKVAARGGADYDYLLRLDQEGVTEAHDIPDERLRLIFTCCHPALEQKSQVALTLRLMGGLTTAEIAAGFLDRETTMGQRLSRAKSKIAAAGIPFRVPGSEEWPERLGAVLKVIYLIFNQGYSSAEGAAAIRADLCTEAIWLGRLMARLLPDEAEIEGLLALMLLAHGRRDARLDDDGLPIAPMDQDRDRWDGPLVDEALALLDRAVARHRAGPFQLQAAISALHMQGPRHTQPDRRQIVMLYDRLMQLTPGPVVALNHAVALADLIGAEQGVKQGAKQGLAALAPLADALDHYQPYHAARADFLARSGARTEARDAYGRALSMTENPADRAFLTLRLKRLSYHLGIPKP